MSPSNPFTDRFGWSGTFYSTRKAIEDAGYRVEWIPSENYSPVFKLKYRLARKLNRLLHGNELFVCSNLSSRLRARNANKQDLDKYDMIFVPGQSDVVARLKTKKPIIRYSDATVSRMLDYYWFGWSRGAQRDANSVEQLAIDRSSLNILSSHWAAESVIKDYHAPEEKVCVLPFGANIDSDRINPAPVYHGEQLNVLFSGVEWERKGGKIAIDAIKKLITDGYDVRLRICGIKDLDPEIANLAFVENLGFLNKNNSEQYQKYLDTWTKTNLFILPTRAECSAIVYCEANAYGVPTITTETGGTGDYIINDVNGYRMPLEADGKAYAAKIEEWIKNDRFEALHEGAVKVYQESTSWQAWGRAFKKALDLITN